MSRFWLAAPAAAVLWAGQACAAPDPAAAAPQAAIATPRLGPWGFDLAGRDLSVRPGEDFFRYSVGAYVKALQIPPDRSRFGAFDNLRELTFKIIARVANVGIQAVV